MDFKNKMFDLFTAMEFADACIVRNFMGWGCALLGRPWFENYAGLVTSISGFVSTIRLFYATEFTN